MGRRGSAVQAFCAAKPWRKGESISPAQIKMGSPQDRSCGADAVAATLILEGYLARRKREGGKG